MMKRRCGKPERRADKDSLLISRRKALALLVAMPAALSARQAGAQSLQETHGLSYFGDLKYPAGFAHFDYVNPDAPVGGTLSYIPAQYGFNQNPQTFNSMNIYILRGDGPLGMGNVFASLMASSDDEPDSVYGLAAQSVHHDETKKYFEFQLRKDLSFHDGSALTADDVVFSIELIKKDGHPALASTLAFVEETKVLGRDRLGVRLSPAASRDVILAVAGAPILSKAYYNKVDFSAVTMTPPLGSGGFKVGRFAQGRFIEYERVKDWWGWRVPAMRGQYNWNRIRIEFYRDRDVAFEAFKAGEYFLREEFTARLWATGYDFPAVRSGAVKKLVLPDNRPTGMQGFFVNIRRDKFKDPRVRKALSLAFDFEWSNANLFYNQYARTQSVFQNSALMAQGKPTPEELALLESYRSRLSPDIFGDALIQPVSNASGNDRRLLSQAVKLLNEASVRITPGGAILPTGERFTIEFLNDDPAFERVILPYIRNLASLGIAARIRAVDASQYQARVKSYDFDVVSMRYFIGLTPGENLRHMFSSKYADIAGEYNLSGLKHPVVDALIEKAIEAKDRPALQTACRALDRVLRSLNFWVPQWYRPSHLLAYWDIYKGPPVKPAYASGIVESWWLDEKQAKKLGKGL